MLCVLQDEGHWLQGHEKIINIVMEFFRGLNSKEEWLWNPTSFLLHELEDAACDVSRLAVEWFVPSYRNK